MGEYIGRINISKDIMLFVVNSIFKKRIKENTTKENILKMIPKIYTKENLQELIKLLPHKAYKALEKLIEFSKNSDNIKDFFNKTEYRGVRYLEEAMIIIVRAKHSEYNYSLNPGIIENLTPMFSDENRKIADRYEKIERLTEGILYAYGVVEINFLRIALCKYMNEIISQEELYDIYFKRLNLNLFVNYYDIRWTNTNQIQSFVTYLDEEEIDIGDIAVEQKSRNLQYKNINKVDILKREEYLWDENTLKFYNYIKSINNNILEYPFRRTLKKNELGEDVLSEVMDMCKFKNDDEIRKFIEMFMKWHNNSPQYILGGYSPIEFREKINNN